MCLRTLKSGIRDELTNGNKNSPFSIAAAAPTVLGLTAIPADMSNTVAVVALGALDTVARHVAYTSASIASPRLVAVVSTTERAVASGLPRLTGLGAVTRHVAGLSAGVAGTSG